MYILGVSALYHDSAAALIENGNIVAAAQEERFTRKKCDNSIPVNAINYCLEEANIELGDLDEIVYYDNPILTMDRFLANVAAAGEDNKDLLNFSFESIFKDKLWINEKFREKLRGTLGKSDRLLITKHHFSHAASAFYPSPFENAAIITMDGVGEWNTTTIGYGDKNKLSILKKIDYPHSIGLLYSAFTYFCGFRVNFGDYKLMGLAPYGEPIYCEVIKRELIDIKEDGSFRLNLKYFDFQFGRSMINGQFEKLFGGKRREPEEKITKREMDIAASIQKVLEEIVLKLAITAKEITGNCENLVLAGGVALNCVANGILAKKGIFKNIWIQPAAGDAGGALGAALVAYYDYYDNERIVADKDSQRGSYLGPEYSSEEIEIFLKTKDIPYKKFEYNEVFYSAIAELLEEQKVIGLFEGRMEYGPRALGNRSIIADARSEKMQAKLNLSIKYRESFRPFAPAVMEEYANDYFDIEYTSPYMLFCGEVKNKYDKDFKLTGCLEQSSDMLAVINRKRSDIPAVTHVDYSARVQTVSLENNEIFYNILSAFKMRTGCGVLINTSFNVRGEPIVCTPQDAYFCFMNTEMDVLILNNFLLYKNEQPEVYLRKDIYELD